MTYKLNEILDLIDRIDDLDRNSNEKTGTDEYSDLYNNGNVLSPILTKNNQKQEKFLKTDYASVKNTPGNYVLFTDMIEKIGLYNKPKSQIIIDDIENKFIQDIKGTKIYCPILDINELRNEILFRNSEKTGEQYIEFSNNEKNKNVQNIKTSDKVFGRYAPIYYNKISRNINGRLGMMFELLFGKTPDISSNADFGAGENSVEIKTKHQNSGNGIIAITKFGLETISELFDYNSVSLHVGNLKEQLVIILNERLAILSSEQKLSFDDMSIKITNVNTNKIGAVRKRIPSNLKIQDGAVLFNEGRIATISIEKNGNRNTTPLVTYNISLSATLEQKGKDWFINLLYSIEDSHDEQFSRYIDAKANISLLLDKIAKKCPTLLVATGDDTNFQVPGWDCQSDVYVYNKADIFKWSGMDDSQIALYLIKAGLLKVDFSMMAGVLKSANTIQINCILSFDYNKIIKSLTMFGREIFSEQQLFVHEKTI